MARSVDELLKACTRRLPTLESERLMLYAGANLPSERAIAAYNHALSAYPAMGPSYQKEQPDTDLVSELEVAASNAACELFGAAWAEVRIASCTLANLAIYHAYCRPGDLILGPSAAHGGHLSQRQGGTPALAGLSVIDLPFNTQSCTLDTAGAAAAVLTHRPRLVVLGRSVMLSPDVIGPVVDAAREVGARTLFDASHVMGLIAGGCYPNPFDAGVDLISSSTYKTLPGRPQGLVLGRCVEDAHALREVLNGRMLANYDAGRLPSLLVTLEEARLQGASYALRILDNTAALNEALRHEGFATLAATPGHSYTHQILLPLADGVVPHDVMIRLQDNGVLLGSCADPTREGGSALRLGTQFITRQALAPNDMKFVARRLSSLLKVVGCGSRLI